MCPFCDLIGPAPVYEPVIVEMSKRKLDEFLEEYKRLISVTPARR